MITTPRRALAALLVVTALAVAGCGSEDDVIETEGAQPSTTVAEPISTPPPETTAADPPTSEPDVTVTDTADTGDPTTDAAPEIAYDSSPDSVLLHLATGGGFVPMEYHFTELPSLVIYGDGRVLRTGDIDLNGSIRPVEELQLDEEGMQLVLALAKEAGLLGPGEIDYGSPNVTDLPGTSLSIATADGSFSHSAYALGFGEDLEGADPPPDGLTDEQRERRAVLSEFIDQVEQIETLAGEHAGPAKPYVADSVAVQSFAAPGDAGSGELKPWPVDEVDPPKVDTCTVLTGPEAAAAAEALAGASIATTWTLSGRMFKAVGRPILPGEEGCA